MGKQQEIIDQLIDYIDKAILKNSVSNRQVAAVLSFLNETLKEKGMDIEELAKFFIRKDQPDFTNYLLSVLGGANIGEAIDSFLSGKGTVITSNGRIQTDYLEVRKGMKILELIINEISAMYGDYSFSDAGTIERVEDLGENTYRLWISKRTDTDWTTLDVDDVMYSIINSLRTGGTDYYTSWFRCLAKNVNDNALTVVLYPDNEVPGGKNFAPASGYNLTRRGSANIRLDGSHNERSDSWMLSSREGSILFLQNVFKPILEDYNYALSIGRFPKIDAIKHLPIGENDMGILAKTIVCENLYRYDYNGNIIASEVFRGEWSAAVASGNAPYRFVTHKTETSNGSKLNELEQHTVYLHGCKWGCLVDKTTDEPKWNSPGWAFLEGNNNYSISFAGTAGFQFFYGAVNTTVVASVLFGSRDITAELLATPGADVQWTRNTENVPDDNAWHPTFDGAKNCLKLTQEDMGRDWLIRRKTIFICTVFIPSGEGFRTKSEKIGFNL